MLKKRTIQGVAQVDRAPHFLEVSDVAQLQRVVDELNNPGAVVVVEIVRLSETGQAKALGFLEGVSQALGAHLERITRTRYALKNEPG